MAMTTCKECKAQISTTAETCPHCGAKPRRTSGCAMIVAAFFGLVLFSAIVSQCTGGSSNSSSPTSSGSTPASTPAAPAKTDPATVFAEAKRTVEEIEARLKSNADRLKKYYGTTDQVKQATADVIRLAAVKGLYGKSSVKEEKGLSDRAESLANKVMQQQRVIYASAAEEIFVKSGMDVKVSAAGKNKDQLRLRYVLMSQPLVYKFQNEMKLDQQAKAIGFKKLIYTDGYDETWTIDL